MKPSSPIRCVLVAAAIFGTVGCSNNNRRLLVPGPEMVGAASNPPQPYVVRMSDGRRDWEVEFPESASGYEVQIPLRTAGGEAGGVTDLADPMTDADRELLSELRRGEDVIDGEGIHRGEDNLITGAAEEQDIDPPEGDGRWVQGAPRSSDDPAPSRPSYLRGVAEVRRLYRGGNPELAMIRVTQLLRAYPNDPRLLAMKGTLWLRLGRPEMARRVWEEVLRRDPENRSVRAALTRLNRSMNEAAEESSAESEP